MAWVATAVIGSAVIGGAATAYAANRASNAQQAAADKAANTTLSMYNQTRSDLEPYRGIGQVATEKMTNQLDALTAPINIDAVLNDPNSTARKAYDFTLQQGLKATQNSAAARGLGSSGAALKGAAEYTTGLANKTYGDLFNMENVNRTNAYNRLKGLIDTGQNAAAQTGSAGTSAANTAAQAQIGAGNAQAAGINAAGGAVSNAANNIGGYMAYRGLYGNQPQNQGA